MQALNFDQYQAAIKMCGTEVNDYEYIDHVMYEGGNAYFVIIHLNGAERNELVTNLI